MRKKALFIGIDWGSERHAICVLREDGSVVKEQFVDNDARALDVIARLTAGLAPAEVVVGVETRRLPLVDALMARGYRVYSINPKQAERFRDRFGPGGAKDDRRDARAIGDALRTDVHCFDVVEAEDAHQHQMRAALLIGGYIDDAFRTTANRLYHVVLLALPTLIGLCPAADEPWYWALLIEVLDNGDVDDEKLGAILKDNRIRRLAVDDVRAVLSRPRLATADGVREAAALQAHYLVDQLRLLATQRASAERLLKRTLEASPQTGGKSDADILRTVPGIADKTAAVILVEGHAALLHGNLRKLRGLAGVAPVSKSTGKGERAGKRRVSMRRASSRRLRNAMHHAANSARRHPRFAAIYKTQIARGGSHGRACRAVADRMLSLVVAMLRDRTEFAFTPNETPSSSVELLFGSCAAAQASTPNEAPLHGAPGLDPAEHR